MSTPPTPPTRPSLAHENRPRGQGSFLSFALKTAWIPFSVFLVLYLMNTRGQQEPQAPTVTSTGILPPAQALPEPAAQASPVPVPPPQPSLESVENIELNTAASIQRQQLTTAKFKQRQVIGTYDEVKRALDEWESELTAWEKAGPALARSETGNKLSGDASLVKRYRVVLHQERLTREDYATARQLADSLISPVRDAANNSEDASVPHEDITTHLREIRTRARNARDEVRGAREQIQALLAEAGDALSKQTLQDAIRLQAEEEARKRNALIEAQVKAAEEQGNRTVAEERAKAALATKQREADSIQRQSEIARANAAQEAAEQKALALKGQLRRKIQGDDVRHYLGAFMANGYSQPAGFTGNKRGLFKKIGSEGPISFSAIKGMGGLDRGRGGLERLAQIGSATDGNGNDRPSWGFNGDAHYWNPETFRFVQKAQDLLNELGPTMVEMKLLAP